MMETLQCSVEVREEGESPQLVATVLAEGRAATAGRRELFIPGSCAWPSKGIEVLLEHFGQPEARAVPVRNEEGCIEIQTPATPAIVEAVKAGSRYMSIEFVATRERQTVAGIREVLQAVLLAATLTATPEYDTTVAEIRTKRRRVWL